MKVANKRKRRITGGYVSLVSVDEAAWMGYRIYSLKELGRIDAIPDHLEYAIDNDRKLLFVREKQ